MNNEEITPQPMYLGLDVGQRRVGVAVSTPEGSFALPVETVDMKKKDAGFEAIAQMIEQRNITHVVVGWPLTLEGNTGRATDRVDVFVASLTKKLEARQIEVDYVYWDERLTTIAAEAFLIGEDVSRRRRKRVVDQIAATHILEGYLQSIA